ncbi:hypothetical protein GGR57DRAFT_499072 [Xylariaceae sp. FL1272]|nr:hypothetical protein GGR57DRAFT_499072 [Xylariaceae sp. FL1272]
MSAARVSPPVTGQFAFLHKIGATPEAVATLNDQPYVFFVLVAALIIQKKKEKKKDEKKPKPGGKPPAQR